MPSPFSQREGGKIVIKVIDTATCWVERRAVSSGTSPVSVEMTGVGIHP
jgi:hypothetical protein